MRSRSKLRDMQPLLVIKEEFLPEHQEWNVSVDQEDIKEEEKLWVSHQGEQLQQLEEADLTKFGFTAVPVKSENDDEKPESSQLHQSRSDESTEAEPVASSSSVHRTLTAEADGEDDGGSQPASNSGPNSHLQPDTSGRSSDSSGTETDESYDWKQTRELKSRFNCRKNTNIVCSGNTDEKQFKGSIYGKAFGHRNNSEQQKERQASGKPFSCSDGSKKQEQKSTLNRDIRIQTGQKRFDCSECGQRFGRKSTLNNHMIIHTGQKAFACSECGQMFGLKRYLNTHMIIHTGQKPFVCSECGQRFGQKSHLNAHIIIHTGQKPFVCSECGQRFRQKGTLNRHMIIHTGQKPFVCSECGQRFGQKSHLNAHMIIHTGRVGALEFLLDTSLECPRSHYEGVCQARSWYEDVSEETNPAKTSTKRLDTRAYEENGATSPSTVGRHLLCISTQLGHPPDQPYHPPDSPHPGPQQQHPSIC